MGIKKFFKEIFEGDKTTNPEATKDRTYTSEHTFSEADMAREEFEKAKVKLFDVNQWSELSGLSSKFELYDNKGVRSDAKKLKTNDYIKILLPGPAPENWVIVTDLKESADNAYFVVSPSQDPQEREGEVEHFFIKEATSTFKVERVGNTIKAYEIGKKEGINNQGYEAGEREVINTIIAKGGWAGFQKYQWKKLTDYLVGE